MVRWRLNGDVMARCCCPSFSATGRRVEGAEISIPRLKEQERTEGGCPSFDDICVSIVALLQKIAMPTTRTSFGCEFPCFETGGLEEEGLCRREKKW